MNMVPKLPNLQTQIVRGMFEINAREEGFREIYFEKENLPPSISSCLAKETSPTTIKGRSGFVYFPPECVSEVVRDFRKKATFANSITELIAQHERAEHPKRELSEPVDIISKLKYLVKPSLLEDVKEAQTNLAVAAKSKDPYEFLVLNTYIKLMLPMNNFPPYESCKLDQSYPKKLSLFRKNMRDVMDKEYPWLREDLKDIVLNSAFELYTILHD